MDEMDNGLPCLNGWNPDLIPSANIKVTNTCSALSPGITHANIMIMRYTTKYNVTLFDY